MRTITILLLTTLLACSGSGQDEATVGSETGHPADAPPATVEKPGREAEPEDSENPDDNVLLERARQPFLGDLPELRERRFVRALVSYSKTNFFHDGATARGFEVDLLQAWEKSLNQGAKTYDRIKVVFVPTPFDRLMDDLLEGRGDIAAAGLTVTPERTARVSFSEPYIPKVEEVLVHHRGVDDVPDLDSLSGRRVLVRSGGSYVEHLKSLNQRLDDNGARAVEIVEADPRLVTEDLLEMVNSGAIEMTVADRHIAEAWAEVLPDIVVRDDLALHSGGTIAWAVRPDSPRLLESLNALVRENRKGSLLGNILFKRYYAKSKWIANPVSPAERAKLQEHIALFQKYGEQYGFDWLALAAQAYQESGLDQSVESSAGAVGVMQIKPSTAADKNVGVPDVHLLENNIHAGTKYLAFLRDRYFSDAEIEPAVQVDFAWAAYNAGPARVRRLRAKAADRGLDPNRWFFNVERIAAEEIGRETVDYVANINKYYLAYRLRFEANRER